MDETLKQFSDKLAAELKARLSSHQIEEFIKQVKTSGDDRTFEVVMSTADEDRQGDALEQSGWDFSFFKMNPVVLWAHNYSGFPIGIITDIEVKGNQTVATGKFAPQGLNPEADITAALYAQGIVKAVSPGYIQNDDGTRELLEVSFCPVPAGRYALSLRQVQSIGLSRRELVRKGFFYDMKGAVPYSDHGNADPDEAWDGPAQVKACGDDLDKLKAICAWFDSENKDKKSAYKLPHHRASDMKAVWKGVSAAGNAISGARGGVDIPEADLSAVKSHLAKHYKAFDKTPPWEKKAQDDPVLGDSCELDDGSPGVLAKDPKNPNRLVCVPPEEGKSKSNETQEDMNNELIKALKAEHERHAAEVSEHTDNFADAAPWKGKSQEEKPEPDEAEKAIEEFTEKMDGELDQHLEKCMKAIDDHPYDPDPEDKKAIDEFRKAMEDEHLKHAKAFHKAIEEFRTASEADEPQIQKAIEEFRTKSEDELSRHEKAHMDLCEKEMGEGEDEGKALHADVEKFVADLYGTADAVPIRKATLMKLLMKAGRAISAANKAKIDTIAKAIEEFRDMQAADHQQHTDKVIAALKDLKGPESDEGKEDEDGKKSSRAPHQRPSPSGAKTNDAAMSELEAYMFGQRLVRQIKSVSEEGLRQFKDKLGKLSPNHR